MKCCSKFPAAAGAGDQKLLHRVKMLRYRPNLRCLRKGMRETGPFGFIYIQGGHDVCMGRGS